MQTFIYDESGKVKYEETRGSTMDYMKYYNAVKNSRSKKQLTQLLSQLSIHGEKLKKNNQELYKLIQQKKKQFYPQQSFKEYLNEYFGISMKVYKDLLSKGCNRCGSKKSMQLHHKIPKSQGGTNNLENLEPICFKCHKLEHPWLKPITNKFKSHKPFKATKLPKELRPIKKGKRVKIKVVKKRKTLDLKYTKGYT